MNCRDCGEPIQFLVGDRRPYDLTPRIHYANPAHIAAVRNGAPTRRQPKKSGDSPATDPMATEVVSWLQGPAHKLLKADAERFVAAAGPAEDADTLYLAALGQINAEMLAVQRAALKRKGAAP